MQCVCDAKATVGEGPTWDSTRASLFWVDIEGRTVHEYHPGRNQDRVINLPDYVGAVVPRSGNGVMVAMRGGFYHVDLHTELVTLVAPVEADLPDHRFNDGKCDALGRFWAGTVELSEQFPVGALYCLDRDLSVNTVLHGVTDSNGLGWSPDNRTMYYIDSATRNVTAYDFDLTLGALSRPRVAIHIDDGIPDGMTVDSEGMVWIAHWGAFKISRWDPGNGNLLEELRVPVAQVTSLTFGGPDLRRIYVTSAARGLSVQECLRQPNAGGIFAVDAKVAGLPAYPFAG